MLNALKPLITTHFWFNFTAVPFVSFIGYSLLAFTIVAMLAGGIVYYYPFKQTSLSKERRALIRKAATLLFWCSFTILFLYVSNWQAIPFVSMRIFLLIPIGSLVAGAFVYGRTWFVKMPAVDIERAKREAYEKWLPKPKNHR